MPKGGSGFRAAASGAASDMVKHRGGGMFVDNSSNVRGKVFELFKHLYRQNGITFDRDDKGKVIGIHINKRAIARIDAVADALSQNTIEYNREANERYRDLRERFKVNQPVFIRIEDSSKTQKEQLEAGHFKIRTQEKRTYKVNGRTVGGGTFRRNSMRERYEQAMGTSAMHEIESRHAHGGTTDATWLNAANKALDNAKSQIYTRRGDNTYSSDYFSDLVRRYEKVSRNADSKRRK